MPELPKHEGETGGMESGRAPPSIRLLRQWITWAAVIGTALWAGYFFVFLVLQSMGGGTDSHNWFLRMIQDHPAATIGVGMSAVSAFCLVALLEISRGPIEFEALSFKFKGASGPVVLWVLCFLVMVHGVWLLWDKEGNSASSVPTAPVSSEAAK